MKELTNTQIEKINKHLSKMTEAQQDVYIQKLEEAGFLDKILGSIGSPKKNLEKLKKQQQVAIAQIDSMINAINASTAVQDQNQKNIDIQALQSIKDALNKVNLNIQLDESPTNNNGTTEKGQKTNAQPANK